MSTSTDPVKVTLNQKFVSENGCPATAEMFERLAKLAAHSDTGGASVAAQLLLALYDGAEYPFDLTELCRLDSGLLSDALNAIEFRVRERIEPHEFFQNGGQLFQQIAKTWNLVPKSQQSPEA